MVTPASVEFVEKYFAWKAMGGGKMWGADELTAREAEAFLTRWIKSGEGEDEWPAVIR